MPDQSQPSRSPEEPAEASASGDGLPTLGDLPTAFPAVTLSHQMCRQHQIRIRAVIPTAEAS